MVFRVTDGVSTPEEVPLGRGELMSPVMKSSLSSEFEALEFFKLEFCSGGSILSFIGCKIGDRLEYLSSANTSSELSQSLGEPILAFIGYKTRGKPNR